MEGWKSESVESWNVEDPARRGWNADTQKSKGINKL